MKSVTAIIVAAGEGRRFGSLKQFALLKGKLILDWCLETFNGHKKVGEIVLVLPDLAEKEKFFARYKKVVAVVKGGKKRQDSVLQGFNQVDPRKTEIVLVHDGVRPLVGEDLISRVIQGAQAKQAVVPGILLEDTVKEVAEGEVFRTLEREKLFRIQTPQGFSYSLLKMSLQKAFDENYYGTDEARLVERLGKKVFIVQGDPRNFKITTPTDIRIAEALLDD